MKKTYPFELLDEGGLIVVEVEINEQAFFRFLLDTGATNTSIDKNLLYIEQIELKESLGQVHVETANGLISADVFQISTIKVLGEQHSNYPIQVFDFVEHGMLGDYAGILGMDILGMKNLCIHYRQGYLTFE
jgi:predicted aspartyl protease